MRAARTNVRWLSGVLIAGCLSLSSSAHGGPTPTNLYVGPVTNNVALHWLWTTQYWLQVEADAHGAVWPTGEWYDAGTSVGVKAKADPYYHFTAWTGSGTNCIVVGGMNDSTVTVAVLRPMKLEGHFAANLAVRGTPEWWLARFGWTNNFDAAATNDQDGDGVPTCDEFPADTIPTNEHSVLSMIAVRPTNGHMWVQWKGGEWATQYLELRQDLVSTSDHWRVVYTNLPLPTPITNWILDIGVTNVPVYYRVKVPR